MLDLQSKRSGSRENGSSHSLQTKNSHNTVTSRSKLKKTSNMNVATDPNKKFQQIKSILTKPSEQRSSYELRTVLAPLMADISFFKKRKLKQHEINEVCNGLEYMCLPKDSFVLKYGDEGDLFYIILKGRCSVWIPTTIQDMRKPMHQFQDYVKGRDFDVDDFKIEKSILDEHFGPLKDDSMLIQEEEDDD